MTWQTRSIHRDPPKGTGHRSKKTVVPFPDSSKWLVCSQGVAQVVFWHSPNQSRQQARVHKLGDTFSLLRIPVKFEAFIVLLFLWISFCFPERVSDLCPQFRLCLQVHLLFPSVPYSFPKAFYWAARVSRSLPWIHDVFPCMLYLDLLSEAGFENVFRPQNWARRRKLFCGWFCFLLGPAGCISVAAWTQLKVAFYYFVSSGGLIVCC